MKKIHSLKTKSVAVLTAFGLAAMGCASSADETPAEGDPGARQVTLEVWTNVPDDTGARQMVEMGSETIALDDHVSGDRALVVDGVETNDLAALRDGSEIVVPLNTGETATLARQGDRLELVSFTGEDDGSGEVPRGAVRAVRMLAGEYQVFTAGSDGAEADIIVRLSGIEDLPRESEALVTALALQTLLASLEDQEQIPPAAAWAIVVGIVAAGWLLICGATVWDCATRCESAAGFHVDCANLQVSVNPTFTMDIGDGFGCYCH